MTNRDFYNAIINNTINEDVVAHAQHALETLDNRNKARSSKPSKRQLENAPLIEAIMSYVTEQGGAFCADIATALEITPQKVSGLCTQLVNDGKLSKEQRAVPKHGKQMFYTPMSEM